LEFNNELLKKLRLEVDQILDEENQHSEEIYRHEKNMLQIDTPRVWNIHQEGNMEVKLEVEFEQLLFALGERTNEDLNEVVVFRFMSLIQYLKSKKTQD